MLVIFAALCLAPETAQRTLEVRSLQLGHPDYKTREAAERFLKEVWPTSRVTLGRLANESEDPEVRHRAYAIYAEGYRTDDFNMWKEADARIYSLLGGTYPYIDSLWYDTEKCKYFPLGDLCGGPNPYNRYLFQQSHRFEHLNPHLTISRGDFIWHRKASRALFLELHVAGVPLWVIEAMAIEMLKRDVVYERTRIVYATSPAEIPIPQIMPGPPR